jgi:hypothetical protein
MKRSLTTNKWLSLGGWALTGLGFVAQLVPHIKA